MLQINKMRIRVTEIIDLKERIREINSVDLEDIEFLNDKDEVLYIKPEIIDQWKFIGLNNTDFIEGLMEANKFIR
jgi:hypothetical protein